MGRLGTIGPRGRRWRSRDHYPGGDAPSRDGPDYVIPSVEELGCVDSTFARAVEDDVVEFVVERQRVFERRRAGLPPAEWTSDPILRCAKFCCIDRRDDAVTRELLSSVSARPAWCVVRGAWSASAS
eukprot:scaffold10093_cov104-Isochrysis_galbana.AAC.2